MPCVDTIAMYLFYIFIIDFSLEMLDLVHRIYEADEIVPQPQLHGPHQALLLSDRAPDMPGHTGPHLPSGITQVIKLPEIVRKRIYVVSGCLTLIGIFAMRWNVVIGGQLFSKSFLGYTTYKMSLVTKEGLLMAILLTILPLAILWGLVKLLPPWDGESQDSIPAETAVN